MPNTNRFMSLGTGDNAPERRRVARLRSTTKPCLRSTPTHRYRWPASGAHTTSGLSRGEAQITKNLDAKLKKVPAGFKAFYEERVAVNERVERYCRGEYLNGKYEPFDDCPMSWDDCGCGTRCRLHWFYEHTHLCPGGNKGG